MRLRRLEGVRFRRQHALETFVLDFYCPEHRLVIEVDGAVHQLPDIAEHDAERQRYLEQQGYLILRFTNAEVQDQMPDVLQRIRRALGGKENVP